MTTIVKFGDLKIGDLFRDRIMLFVKCEPCKELNPLSRIHNAMCIKADKFYETSTGMGYIFEDDDDVKKVNVLSKFKF